MSLLCIIFAVISICCSFVGIKSFYYTRRAEKKRALQILKGDVRRFADVKDKKRRKILDQIFRHYEDDLLD